MYNQKSISKTLLFTFIIGAAVLAGCARNTTANSTATTGTNEVGTVSTVTVTDQIQTSGSLGAERLTQLMWKTSGIVEAVNVKVGDKVQAGDVLAALHADSVPANLLSAQSDLDSARQNLDALSHPNAQTLATAQKALADAYKAFNTNASDLYSAVYKKEANGNADYFNTVSSAWNALTSARNAIPLPAADSKVQLYYWAARAASLSRADLDYAAIKNSLRGQIAATEADKVDALIAAQGDFETAVTQFFASLTDNASAITLNSAQAAYDTGAENLSAAQQKLYTLTVSPNSSEVAAAQAKVDAAQANVNNVYLIAPFDGEIIAVAIGPGDLVNTGNAGIVLVDRNTLKVDAQVDETDIARVAVGNPATIAVDALPGVALNGKVVSINPIGATVSGLVKYTVTVALEPTDKNILFGATADVTLLTSAPRDMLAVPIGAVQNDTNGEYVLRVNPLGGSERVNIVSDSIQGEVVAISGDLKAGDQVLIIAATTTNNNNQTGPGGGGAFFGPN